MKYLNYRDNVNKIVLNKNLVLKGKTIDLGDMLNRVNKKSIEYREGDLNKIDISKVKKQEKFCEINVRAYDSPDVVFEKRVSEELNGDGICILNFASSKHPGGGFMTGAMAQEESLCYRSNLYDVLKEHMEFYEYNKLNLKKSLYSEGIIFSEKVCFFKDNKYNNCEPYMIDVITCAAPNAKVAYRNSVTAGIIEITMRNRIENIIKVAISNGDEHLVLGAFGCGVFGNNPDFVADEMYDLIINKGYGWYFKKITFAMHDSMSKNTKAFVDKFVKQWNREKKEKGLI